MSVSSVACVSNAVQRRRNGDHFFHGDLAPENVHRVVHAGFAQQNLNNWFSQAFFCFGYINIIYISYEHLISSYHDYHNIISYHLRYTWLEDGVTSMEISKSAVPSSLSSLACTICSSTANVCISQDGRTVRLSGIVLLLNGLSVPLVISRWIDQVENLINLKIDNPNIRIRSADQLGPNVLVTVEQKTESSVKGPAMFCVLPTVFQELARCAVPEDKLSSEMIDGAAVTVVSCLQYSQGNDSCVGVCFCLCFLYFVVNGLG